jgi:hypothetical protein
MTDNLSIWKAIERTDPKQVKPITGKSYSGHSPKPHYIIWKLTRQFGPVGRGFGWQVIHEAYVPGKPHEDGTEQIHECRIRFWWRDGEDTREVESYGATKALYKAKGNYWVDDEDAAKKSLTDAITKAASWLGASADIFMGRWDDSKYVAALEAEARTARERPTEAAKPAETPHDPETGEVRDESNPPPQGVPVPDPDLGDEDGQPPSVQTFINVVKESLPTGWTKDDLSKGYALAVLDNLAKRKGTIKGKKWFDIFVDLHAEAIDRITQDELRRQVRSAIAYKQAQIDGENPSPEDFGNPFGEDIAPKPKPYLNDAATKAIEDGIHARTTLADLDMYEKGLRDGPNPGALAHPKIAAALQFKRSVLLGEADPVVLGEVRVG